MSPGAEFDKVLRTEVGIKELFLSQRDLMFHLKSSADPLLELIGIRELLSFGASQRDTSRETASLYFQVPRSSFHSLPR